jgi:hypothetical protein
VSFHPRAVVGRPNYEEIAMRRSKLFASALVIAAGMAVIAASIAIGQTSGDANTAGKQEIKLPDGWTEADMQACMLAATPGKMHERLTQAVGVWQGKNTIWMGPDAEPITSEGTYTVTSFMDGRFTKSEMKGEMPGMGPYHGFRIDGYDNVSQEFVSTWIDNFGTGIANGKGELASDGKTMTWEYTFNCPLTKKPTTMREVETVTGPNTKTVETFMKDPKSGKEYKMMRNELTKKAGAAT